MPDTILVPQIKIDGVDLETVDPDALLADLRVTRSAGAAATAQLWLDMNETDGDSIQIGAAIEINVVSLDGVQAGGAIFVGPVTNIGIEVEARRTRLLIGAHDASFVLGQKTVSTSRLNMTPKAIIAALATDAGLTSEIDALLGAEPLDHVQETGTAHQFITAVARTFGCEWFVVGSKLVVRRRDAGTAIKIQGKKELRRFSARFSAVEQAASITVRRWDPVAKSVVTANEALSTSAALAATDVAISLRGRASSKADKTPDEGVANPGPLGSGAGLSVLAKGIVGRHEAAMLTGRGEVDVRSDLVPGVRIELEEVKTEWNGTYYVTAVEHVFGDGKPFTSRFTVGALEPTSLADLVRAPRSTTRDRIASSLAIGIVTDTEDPEALNRVKVRIPELSDDNESWWARLVQHGAGAQRGWVTIPEVDDEVIVAFEHGDVQRPYVLGGLWNGVDAVPDVDGTINNGAVESRSFTSRLGHRLEFRDGSSDDQKFVCITLDTTSTKLYLGSDKIEILSADKPITIETNDAKIDLTEQGDVEIKATNIKLEASQNIELKAGSDVTIKGINAVLEASANADVKGSAGVKVESSGITAVKGSMVNIN